MQSKLTHVSVLQKRYIGTLEGKMQELAHTAIDVTVAYINIGARKEGKHTPQNTSSMSNLSSEFTLLDHPSL